MKFSVIIPTYKAKDELFLSLRSLIQNSDFEHEMLVILGPGRGRRGIYFPETEEVLKNFPTVRVVKTEEDLGPYESWNLGASLAKEPVLCFYTDDQYAAPHWDSRIARFYHPERVLTSQLVEPGYVRPYGSILCQNFGLFATDFDEKGFVSFVEKNSKERLAKDGYVIPLVIGKELFSKMGRWPSEAPFPFPNDWLFRKRLHERGYQILRVMDSYNYHFQNSSYKTKEKASIFYFRKQVPVRKTSFGRKARLQVREKTKSFLRRMGLWSPEIWGLPPNSLPGWTLPKKADLELACRTCQGGGIEITSGTRRFPNINTYVISIFQGLKAVYPGPDAIANPYRLPCSDRSQDFILTTYVLDHLVNPIRALQEWKRVLKKGGILFLLSQDAFSHNGSANTSQRNALEKVQTAFEKQWTETDDACPDTSWRGDPRNGRYHPEGRFGWRHFYHWDSETVSTLLESCGFEIVSLLLPHEKNRGFDEAKYRWDDFTVVARVA